MVTLKDPTTGEYLIPRVPRSLAYDVLDDGTLQGPIETDADTLGGHPASDFLLKSEYTPVDLSGYLQTSVADTKYAAISHTHTISNITDLQTELDSLKTSGSEGKSLIASAITAKGVSTASDATFQQMAINIGNIASGNCIAGTNSSIEVQYSSPSIGHTLATVTITDAGLVSIRPTAIFCTCLGSGDCIYKNGTTYSFRWEHRGLTMGDSVNVSIGTGIIIMTCEYQTAFSPPFGSLNLWFAYKI